MLNKSRRKYGRYSNVEFKYGNILQIVNKNAVGKTSRFVTTIGKAGADFKRLFTSESYKIFFEEAGYENVEITMIEGNIPCAVAVMTKKSQDYPLC